MTNKPNPRSFTKPGLYPVHEMVWDVEELRKALLGRVLDVFNSEFCVDEGAHLHDRLRKRVRKLKRKHGVALTDYATVCGEHYSSIEQDSEDQVEAISQLHEHLRVLWDAADQLVFDSAGDFHDGLTWRVCSYRDPFLRIAVDRLAKIESAVKKFGAL